MLGIIVRFFLKIVYRVELRGRENYDAAGERVFILNNPGSIIDPLLIAAVLPQRITLLADSAFENKWWMRPLRALTDTVFLDFSGPFFHSVNKLDLQALFVRAQRIGDFGMKRF